MEVLRDPYWRPGATHHIVVVSDAAHKVRPTEQVGPQPVTPAGAAALAAAKNITISFHSVAPVSAADDGSISSPDLAAALNAVRPGMATAVVVDSAATPGASLEAVRPSDWRSYKLVPSADCVYVSDGVPSDRVQVTFSPPSAEVPGETSTSFAVSAWSTGPPGGETVCTVTMAVNGEVAPQGLTIRLAASPLPPLDLTVTTTARCIAGKAYLTSVVTNQEPIATDVTITSDFGVKAVPGLGPAKTVSHAFTTRLVTLPAGVLTCHRGGQCPWR
jgi:hypothetical protein